MKALLLLATLLLAGAPGESPSCLTPTVQGAELFKTSVAPSAAAPASIGPAKDVYEEDVAFALTELEKQCGGFFKLKGIDWKKVSKRFTKEAKKTRNDQDHWLMLVRLNAQLKDGHCRVELTDPESGIDVPEEWKIEKNGPGFFLCKIGKKYYTKTVWSSAEDLGLLPGMEILSIDGLAMKKWMVKREEDIRDTRSFSTHQHVTHWILNRGFSKETNETLKVEYKDHGGKKRKRTIRMDRASAVPDGPAFYPKDYKYEGKSIRWGHTTRGFGYIHFRRTSDDLFEGLDKALEGLQDVEGMILDFRGNSGGGTDHDELEGRFVPKGQTMPRMARGPVASSGEHPYGGPMIVIVDGTTVSAGETTSGMFKEDGRAYMIGESATAGMSSQKTRIPLPSGKFTLYVSVGSNRQSFNGGRGIEGIGVPPNEIVEFAPNDLFQGIDTITARAEALLEDYPTKDVKYDPKDYDWK
jgi:carboxyl-terminal processing protease